MKVLNEYKGSHHYYENYERDDSFCPSCGRKGGVWVATSGDYYVGGTWLCILCDSKWYCPIGILRIADENLIKQAQQLKTGKIDKPTTKKGN
jgi:hypothetical protein